MKMVSVTKKIIFSVWSRLSNYEIQTIPIVYFSILLCLTYFLSKKPLYNWDILPYMAATIAMTTENIDSIQVQTYRLAKQEIPSETYGQLVSTSFYRETMATNSEYFYQQLPFYTIKPLYIYSVYLLHYECGFLLTTATFVPSLISYFVIGAILFYWMTSYLSYFWSALLSVLVMMFPPLLESARLSTPDSLSTLIIIIAFYFSIQHKSFILSSCLLLLSIFVRLDNILLTLLVVTFLKFVKPRLNVRMISYLSVLAIAFMIYCFINWKYQTYSWQLAFVPQQTSPASFAGSIALADYMAGFIKGVKSFQYSYFLIFLFVLVINRISNSVHVTATQDTWFQMSVVVLMSIIFRFLIYPSSENRLFLPFYLIVILYSVTVLRGKERQVIVR